MKLVTFEKDGARRVGVIRGEEVVVVPVPDMRHLFELGEAGMDLARGAVGQTFPLSEVRLRPPIIPKKFFHTAGNFREHGNEADRANWVAPVLPWIIFFQNIDAIIGTNDPIIYPEHLTEELDYELEKVTELPRIMEFGVMFTPALVVDGEVKVAGKVPSLEDTKKLLG